MKTKFTSAFIQVAALLLLLSTFNSQLSTAFAQGTAFTYQGRLADGATPANGNYDLTFTLFATNSGGVATAGPITNAVTSVSNGLFTVTLDFGAAAFDGADRWLEIAVRTNGFDPFVPLSPRQPITPTPYAINSANLMSPANAPLDIKVNGQRALRLEPTVGIPNLIGGSSSNSIAPGFQASVIGGGGLAGAPNRISASSATIAGGSGHTNAATGAFIGGGWMNSIALNSLDAVIAGGFQNRIGADSFQCAILGGLQNFIGSNTWYSAIGGGFTNVIEVDADNAVISGGNLNRVQFNAEGSGIGGGTGNAIQTNASGARIDGGFSNFIGTNSFNSSIGGGNQNSIGNLDNEAVVGGGARNKIESGAPWATIGGGVDNQIRGSTRYGVVAGGVQNSIQTNTFGAAIGGGGGNTNKGYYATIPGGLQNIAGADYTFAAGRRANAINIGAFVWADSTDADFFSTSSNQFSVRAAGGIRFVTGGAGFTVDGQTVSGSNTFWKLNGNAGTTPGTHFVGTTDNQPLEIKVNGTRALRLEPTGGSINVIGGHFANSAAGGVQGGVIGGGGDFAIPNRVGNFYAVIAGGAGNTNDGNSSFIGGGFLNRITNGSAVVVGGEYNLATGYGAAVVGGGNGGNHALRGANNIASAVSAFVGAGLDNTASGFVSAVVGGVANEAAGSHSFIGGGTDNVIATNGDYAVIAGGRNNFATNYGFAAGRRAKASHTGAFVWADSQNADFASTASNQFLVRAVGGAGINTANPLKSLDVRDGVGDAGNVHIGGIGPNGDAKLIHFGDLHSGLNRGFVSIGENGADDRLELSAAQVVVTNLNGGGRLGIGRVSASNALEVQGEASKTTAGSWLANSDRRIKTDIATVTNALETLDRVRLVSFRYTDEYRAQHSCVQDRRYLNVVAQEFRNVFPEHVKSSGEKLPDGSEVLQVDTYPLTIYSAAAIQELNRELKRRDAENAELKREVRQLGQSINDLKQLVSQLMQTNHE